MVMSDQDKIFKAQAIAQRMQLEADLQQFSKLAADLFAIQAPLKLNPTDRSELDNLKSAISDATASNETRARFLELINKGLGMA